jgi:hypothetical protein
MPTTPELIYLRLDTPIDPPYRLFEIYAVDLEIYRSEDYPSLDAAKEHKAYIRADRFESATVAYDALDLVCAVADLLVFESHNDNLRCRVVINDRYVFEDVSLNEASLCLSSLMYQS